TSITAEFCIGKIMNMTRKTLTLAAMVASLSLLGACSKSDDASAPPPAAPAPSTAPTPAPVPPIAPAPQEQQSAPADQQSMQDKIKESTETAKDKMAEEIGRAACRERGQR